MSNTQSIDRDVLDIDGLEFDVAGAGALEAADSQANNAAYIVVCFNWY